MARRLSLGPILAALLLFHLFVASVLPEQCARAQSIRDSTWIRNVPENSAFYWSMNRMGEQFQALLQSKAVANLLSLAGDVGEDIDLENLDVVELISMIDDDDLDEFREWVAEPENRQLVDVVLDMLSHEVFMYGGPNWSEFAGAYADFTSSMYREMARTLKEGESDEPDVSRMISPETLQRLNVPNTIIGFKVSDRQAALAQFGRLKQLLPALTAEEPQLAELIKVETIRGTEFITLQADGSQIPWDEIPDDEQGEEIINTIKPILEKKTIAVSLGIMDDYVLLTAGTSNEHLEQLGEGKNLMERPELARLLEHQDKKICSAMYVSEDLAKNVYSFQQYIQDLAELATSFLESDEVELDDMLRARIQRDVDALADELADIVPKPGAAISFSFLKGNGYEGFSQAWMDNIYLDGSRQLTLANHLGGDPLIAAVTRYQYKPEAYTNLVKWLIKIDAYVNEFALKELDEDDRKDYDTLREAILPSLKQMNNAMATMIIPSMRDSQTAFVLDAKLSSNQWHVLLPPSERPLTIIEPAPVYGVTDAEQLKKGVSELVAAINEAIQRASEAMPDQIPPLVVPSPQERETDDGEIYYYPVLGALGGDDRIAPTAAISERVGVLAISPDHAERILKPTSPKLGGFFGQYEGKPLASASHCDWSGLVDVVVPWVEFAVSQQLADDTDADTYEMITAIADLLGCVRSLSSVTFLEDDSVVSHFECRMRDLPE